MDPARGRAARERLERDVGLPLVLRSTRGVTLTDAGQVLLAHADGVASRLWAAQEEMRSLRTLRTGRLRVAAFPSACATLIPPALARLAHAAPDLEVWLTELEPPQARAAVLAGEVDLALLFHHVGTDPHDEHRDLTTSTLLQDPVLAVLPAGHRLATPTTSQTELDLAELAGERWTAGCPRCRAHLHALASKAGFHPDVRHSTDDYVVTQNLVAAGLAVALLPALALRAVPDDRVVTRRVVGNPTRQVSLVHRREAADLPALQAGVRALTTPHRPMP